VYDGPGNTGLDFSGRALTLLSEAGASQTVIDCADTSSALVFDNGETEEAQLIGFAIVNGYFSVIVDDSSPTIRDCAFSGNGTALYCRAAFPTVVSCSFSENEVYGFGAAIYCREQSSLLVEDSSFVGNVTSGIGGFGGDGGAISVDRSSLVVRRCVFSMNETRGGTGGAVSTTGGDSTVIESCTFADSQGSSLGGALYLGDGVASATMSDCSFVRNASYYGGALAIQGCDPSIDLCRFVSNEGHYGAALFFWGFYGELHHCTVVDNRGSGSLSSQLFLKQSSPEIANCILAFADSARLMECDAPPVDPTIRHCIVFGNSEGDSLCGGYRENLFTDPLLCAVAAGDCSLCSDSPALPEGNPWREHVGALWEGCGACGSVVQRETWGRVKSRYR
jgi:hypothetical protein